MTKKKKTKVKKIRLGYLSLLLLGLLIIGVFAAFRINSKKTPPVSEVTELPTEVKDYLKNTPPTPASVSAYPVPTSVRIPILMYHYVEYVKDPKDTIRQSLDINPATFDLEVKTLKDAGFTFLTNAELSDILDAKAPIPPKPVLLTFDDGYRDFYTDAFPILKKYHAKATAYIITGFLGEPNNLTWDQLKEISKSGLVEIGDHTINHPSLAKKPYKFVEEELEQSKQTLENGLGIKVVSFAYPYGSFDLQAIAVVKAAGFKTAVSTIPGDELTQQNRFFLPRIRPGGRVGPALLQYLQQLTFQAY